MHRRYQLLGAVSARMRALPILLVALATFANADEYCIDAPYLKAVTEGQSNLVAVYEEIAPALDRFPSLRQALEEMAPELCTSNHLDDAQAYLDVEKNRIVISQGLPKGMQIGVLLHEIRHLGQLFIGSCPSDNLAMAEYARATFALEADASAISLLVAWDMKENGNDSAWIALSSWASQSDIALSFANEMNNTGDVATAVSTAFDQWYTSRTRREQYYFASCSDYLDRQDASHALPRYLLIPEEFFENLCRLPDGSSYQCAQPDIDLY